MPLIPGDDSAMAPEVGPMTRVETSELLTVLRENATEQRQTSGALIALTTELRAAYQRADKERAEDREVVKEQSRRLEGVEDEIRALREVQTREITLRETEAERAEARAARAEEREIAREERAAKLDAEAREVRRKAIGALWAKLGLPTGALATVLVAWLSGWIGGADPTPQPESAPPTVEVDSTAGATDKEEKPTRRHTRNPGEFMSDGLRALPDVVERAGEQPGE